MNIAYLNGNRLNRAVIAAAQRVLETYERLNNINVFPQGLKSAVSPVSPLPARKSSSPTIRWHAMIESSGENV